MPGAGGSGDDSVAGRRCMLRIAARGMQEKNSMGTSPKTASVRTLPEVQPRVHEEDRTAAAIIGSHAGSARLTGISVSTATVTPRDHIANREIILGSLMQKDKDQFVKPCFKSCFSNLQIYEIH